MEKEKYIITLQIQAEDLYQARDWIDWLLEPHFDVETDVIVDSYSIDNNDNSIQYQKDYSEKE